MDGCKNQHFLQEVIKTLLDQEVIFMWQFKLRYQLNVGSYKEFILFREAGIVIVVKSTREFPFLHQIEYRLLL